MQKISWLLILLLAIGLIAGCGEDDDPELPNGEVASNLTVIAGDEQVTLEWEGETGEMYTEFKIYQAPATTPVNQLPAPLATVTGNSYVVNGLSNDVTTEYQFHLRTVDKDGNLVEPSNTVGIIPRPEGTGKVIYEFAASGNSGFDFGNGRNSASITMTFANKAKIDFYLGRGTTQNGDPTTDNLCVKSPHLVTSANDWSDRVTNISGVGQGDLDDFGTAQVSNTSFAATAQVGHVYHIKLVDADGDGQIHYAKIKITSMNSAAGSGEITFEYAYQKAPNYSKF